MDWSGSGPGNEADSFILLKLTREGLAIGLTVSIQTEPGPVLDMTGQAGVAHD